MSCDVGTDRSDRRDHGANLHPDTRHRNPQAAADALGLPLAAEPWAERLEIKKKGARYFTTI